MRRKSPGWGARRVVRAGKFRVCVGADDEREVGALRSDRYYIVSDAGSFFFEPGGDNDGFDRPAAAAEWARAQTAWPGLELDLSDGYSVLIVLGSEFNANQAAWEAWEGGGFPDAPRVHNYAESLGLVAKPSSAKRRQLLDRLKWW